ncbi:heme exporter protein CcmD [Methylocapsa polymorpha]|uniref:Heme exporter protein D n=1 Tax=Methylocapsa polymorpha TaxID=3080828 RepID=A0ABZ0HVG0_9HYPH|nr:heme exporter protein CcmD [Methylocapsa sp. RX1]
MSSDPNFGFVIAAYALAFVIVAGMTLLILRDYLNLKRELSRFAARTAGESSDHAPAGREGRI